MSIEGLGANKSEKAIKRVAKAMGALSKTAEWFDSEVGVSSPSGKHSEESQLKDLIKVIQQLLECDSFNRTARRYLRSFPHIKRNLLKALDEKS